VTLATTVDALVDRVRRDSLLSSRGPLNTLQDPYTAGGTSLVLNEIPTHIGVGEIISVDYELMYVQNVASATKTVTVIPGYFGTDQDNHAQNAIIEIASRFPKAALRDHVEHEIRSWSNELWRVTTIDVDSSTNLRTYDLDTITGQVYFLLEVRQKPVGTGTQFWNFSWTQDAWPHMPARLLREMDTAEFTSTLALQLQKLPTCASILRVSVAQPFELTTLDGGTDLVDDVGLRADWLDIVEYGTKMRALETNAIGRSDWRTSNMAREAEEVSALDTIRAVAHFRDMRQMRFTKAGVDLRAEFPYRTI
jgi:hypothetical protein